MISDNNKKMENLVNMILDKKHMHMETKHYAVILPMGSGGWYEKVRLW